MSNVVDLRLEVALRAFDVSNDTERRELYEKAMVALAEALATAERLGAISTSLISRLEAAGLTPDTLDAALARLKASP